MADDFQARDCGGSDRSRKQGRQRTVTYGGYSDSMVANERCIIHFPDNMPLAAGAPLLCAGITMYSPLKYFGLSEPGMHIGIVGLGHVGVKFAKAFGVKVTVISTSPSKKDEALKQFGADSFLVSRNDDEMEVSLQHFAVVYLLHPLLRVHDIALI